MADNLFIGCSNEYAIRIGGRRITVTGNQIDLTQMGDYPDNERVGICIEASNVLAADNQIYARGPGGQSAGISIADHAVNVQAHDNLIENCQVGIRTGRLFRDAATEPDRHIPAARIRRTGRLRIPPYGIRGGGNRGRPNLPLPGIAARLRRLAGAHAGWQLRWLTGAQDADLNHRAYDAQPGRSRCRKRWPSPAGARFAVYPRHANWQIHHNTLADCAQPLVMELFDQAMRCEGNAVSPPPEG